MELIINCRRCGRDLTNPISMYVGFGPICSGYLGIERPEYNELMALNPDIEADLAKLRVARQEMAEKWETVSKIEGTVTLEHDMVIIKFKWGCDNFDQLKTKVKKERARWNPVEKQWEASKDKLPNIIASLKRYENIAIDEGLFEELQDVEIEDEPFGKCEISENQLAISFEYGCPNFRYIKNGIKKLGSRWDPKKKIWTYLMSKGETDKVIARLEKYDIPVSDNVKKAIAEEKAKAEKAIEASQAMSLKDFAELEIEGLGGALYPFQKAGVAYAIEKERVLIASEMGTGKTPQALAWLQAKDAFPSIVVCPASLKLNWEREANIWLPKRSVTIVSGTGNGKNGNATIPDSDITIINYDILSARLETLKKRKFKAVVLDESHYIKNQKSIRTKSALELRKGIPLRLCLTGTPIVNRPVELVQQLSFLGRMDDMGGFWHFVKHFCKARKNQWGWDLTGASNLEELNEKLRASCMVRHRKQDVLTELPDKQRVFIPVEIDNRAEYNDAVNNFIFWLEELKGKKLEKLAKKAPEGTVLETIVLTGGKQQASYPEHLVKIEVLKQITARGKLSTVKEWITNFLETGEKLVVFAHHKEIVADLFETFKDVSVKLVGDTAMEDRQAAVDRFQTDEDCRLFIGSTKAAGVGITLTAASNVAFVELGWTPAEHSQAEDRTHRIGQENAVTAWYFIGQNTIDDDIYDLILSKKAVVDMTTDGTTKTNVVEKMIDRLVKGVKK